VQPPKRAIRTTLDVALELLCLILALELLQLKLVLLFLHRRRQGAILDLLLEQSLLLTLVQLLRLQVGGWQLRRREPELRWSERIARASWRLCGDTKHTIACGIVQPVLEILLLLLAQKQTPIDRILRSILCVDVCHRTSQQRCARHRGHPPDTTCAPRQKRGTVGNPEPTVRCGVRFRCIARGCWCY